ncbi:ORF_87 [Adoxophyes orana granulovirus]|uniref:ADOR87 n=1 Tax=Adoxophyes orana granulovirus TaxID=170617 RepID=Q7T9S8_GVAO|nr:ORF_87 [Adoxophyes orana granulovirus]AAP85724.1 ORF_87 [Adoxophyes orana granulovirus]AJA91727.1 ADOR87 [Adoxophyes orana granulovirus]
MSSLEGNCNNNKRIKYDSQLFLKYIFDYKQYDTTDVPNIINICRVQVRKKGGALLAHYYAQVYLANGYSFEFHPGSQPKTFQNVNDNKNYIMCKSVLLCEKCCRKELTNFIDGENNFNIAFQNCETILCKRKSVQTVLGSTLLAILIINIIKFSAVNIIFIIFLVLLMYMVNNFLLNTPNVYYCEHYILN